MTSWDFTDGQYQKEWLVTNIRISIYEDCSPVRMNIRSYPCSICGSTSFNEVYPNRHEIINSAEEYKSMMSSSSSAPLIDALARCAQCGHRQTNPRLELEEVLKGYATAIDPNHVNQDKYREKTFVRTVSRLNSLAELRDSPRVRVLDIGCASGAFLNSVKRKYSWEGVGLEPSVWMCNYGKKTYGLDLRPGYFSAELFPPSSFDLVTLWDVIEHISEPNQILCAVSKVLEKNGCLIINVPNSNSAAARILGRRWPFILAVHIHYFTSKSINQILENNGFELVEEKPYFQSLGIGYLIKRFFSILGWQSKNLELFSALDRFSITYNMGQTTFVAKRKQ